MANEPAKSVVVKNASTGRDDTYDTAGYIVVRDGHLVVLDGNWQHAQTIAMYAPGEWRHAEVKESSPA